MTKRTELSDTVLISRLQQSEELAFRELVERFQDQVYHTCFALVQKAEDAEDLAQEVFVEVYRSIQGFRAEAKLSTWLYRIATNKSLEFLRNRKRAKRFAFFQALRGQSEEMEKISHVDDHPGVALENQERARILMQAIGQLPEKQKVAFSLHKLEGLSYQEISEIMQTSLSSVESLMFRAKKNLQKRLYQYYRTQIKH